MKNRIFFMSFMILILMGCYGVNKKTSAISLLNTTCFSEEEWLDMKKMYNTDSIKDSILLEKIRDIKNEPFPSDILYFKDSPNELIGVNYSCIRYVYNPLISDQILDGLSPQLTIKEKKRIVSRVQSLIMGYQCEKGKLESLEFINAIE